MIRRVFEYEFEQYLKWKQCSYPECNVHLIYALDSDGVYSFKCEFCKVSDDNGLFFCKEHLLHDDHSEKCDCKNGKNEGTYFFKEVKFLN